MDKKELSFKDAILTVRQGLEKLTIVGSESARILCCACDDLETIANAIDAFVKIKTGGDKNDSSKNAGGGV